MSDLEINVDRVLNVAGLVCDETAAESDLAEMDAILLADQQSRNDYLDYCWMHVALESQLRVRAAAQKAHQQISAELGVPVPSDINAATDASSSPMPLNFFSTTLHTTLGYFSEGIPLAYLLATVLFGAGLLIGSRIYVSGPERLARDISPVTGDEATHDPQMPFVGRITGMVDCQWADAQTAVFNGTHVSLGRKYALTSGLMEISYDTGAKVILQGPCTYEVESCAGGYLSVGKLTARVEKKDERRTRNVERSGSDSSFLIPISYFIVRTPTAAITDLGTEFGVNVAHDGSTETEVLVGAVRVTVPKEADANKIVHVGSAIRADRQGKLAAIPSDPQRYVRTLPSRVDAYGDLVLSMKPVVYYRMNEWPKLADEGDYVLVDSAPGAHHGVLHAAKQFLGPSSRGRFGGGLDLHGAPANEYAMATDYPKTDNGTLSVSAWVRAIAPAPDAVIVENWSAPEQTPTTVAGQFALGLHSDLHLLAVLQQPDGTPAAVRDPDEKLPQGEWLHVAFVADGSVLHLYRNGVEVASTPYNGINSEQIPTGLGVGCQLDMTSEKPRSSGFGFWNGRLDEIAIFNHALSAEQVRQLCKGSSGREEVQRH